MLGDVLEAVGLLVLAAAVGMWAGPIAALVVFGVALVYVGNCHSKTRLPRFKLPRREPGAKKS